jgi:hypothetical protein
MPNGDWFFHGERRGSHRQEKNTGQDMASEHEGSLDRASDAMLSGTISSGNLIGTDSVAGCMVAARG